MRADLPYKLQDFLNFEGLMAAAEAINCLPNNHKDGSRDYDGKETVRKTFQIWASGPKSY